MTICWAFIFFFNVKMDLHINGQKNQNLYKKKSTF